MNKAKSLLAVSLSTDFIQLIIKEGVGVALFLCCAVRLRYVPQAALRSFRDATGGCVSLRSTDRPFAAPLPFAPPENTGASLAAGLCAAHRTLAPAGTPHGDSL